MWRTMRVTQTRITSIISTWALLREDCWIVYSELDVSRAATRDCSTVAVNEVLLVVANIDHRWHLVHCSTQHQWNGWIELTYLRKIESWFAKVRVYIFARRTRLFNKNSCTFEPIDKLELVLFLDLGELIYPLPALLFQIHLL